MRGSHRGRRTPVAIVKDGIRDLSRRCKAVDGAERDNSGLKRIRRLRVQSRNLRDMMDVPHSSAVRPHREIPSQIPALIVGSRWIARLPSSVTYWLPRRLALDTEWPPVYGAFLSDINYVVSCSTARHILIKRIATFTRYHAGQFRGIVIVCAIQYGRKRSVSGSQVRDRHAALREGRADQNYHK